ncbi:MAG: hypothetical protein ACPG46_12590 [Thalassotalea sp.]
MPLQNKQRKQFVVVLLLLWLHVTVLDLFFLTSHKVVFLWEDSFAPLTLLVHFAIALAASLIYLAICRFRQFLVRSSAD